MYEGMRAVKRVAWRLRCSVQDALRRVVCVLHGAGQVGRVSVQVHVHVHVHVQCLNPLYLSLIFSYPGQERLTARRVFGGVGGWYGEWIGAMYMDKVWKGTSVSYTHLTLPTICSV